MKKAFLILSFSILLLPLIASAITLNLDYPSFGGIDITTNKNGGQELGNIIAWFYYLIVGISGLAAFAVLVFGGIQWLSSAGNPGMISGAKEKIRSALLGLLLILGSFLILQIINPEIVILKTPGLTDLTPVPPGITTKLPFLGGVGGNCSSIPPNFACGTSYNTECSDETQIRISVSAQIDRKAITNAEAQIFKNIIIPGESGWNPGAVNNCSPNPPAIGLYQFDPDNGYQGIHWAGQTDAPIARFLEIKGGVDSLGNVCSGFEYWATGCNQWSCYLIEPNQQKNWSDQCAYLSDYYSRNN